MVTEATPGHDGARVSCCDALQDGGLVDVDGEVLRTGQDDRFPVEPGSCNWTRARKRHQHRERDQVLKIIVVILPRVWSFRLGSLPSVCSYQ